MDKLNVYSIFQSISGEVGFVPQGTITTFVRLAGCDLRCNWCDTKKAQEASSGTLMNFEKIKNIILEYNSGHILFTGGEPLLQAEALNEFIKYFRSFYYALPKPKITVETNGCLYFAKEPYFDPYFDIYFVVDYKLPDSGMYGKMPGVHRLLTFFPSDFLLKFVCCDEQDMDIAIFLYQEIKKKTKRSLITFSVAGNLTHAELLNYLLEKGITDTVINTQIHKWIWPEGEKEK